MQTENSAALSSVKIYGYRWQKDQLIVTIDDLDDTGATEKAVKTFLSEKFLIDDYDSPGGMNWVWVSDNELRVILTKAQYNRAKYVDGKRIYK